MRMVQISTDEVYGTATEGSFTEKDPLNPSNPYSASKAAADMFALSYHKTFGLNVSITRCTNNFGPYQLPEKLIPKTIIRAFRNLSIPLYGTGTNIRDWIYVLDHCSAVATVLEKGVAGEIYNVSAGNEVTNVEIVKLRKFFVYIYRLSALQLATSTFLLSRLTINWQQDALVCPELSAGLLSSTP